MARVVAVVVLAAACGAVGAGPRLTLFDQAMVARAAGDFRSCIELARRSALEDRNGGAWAVAGECYFNRKEWTWARDAFVLAQRAGVRLHPQYLAALASSMAELGLGDAARKTFGDAVLAGYVADRYSRPALWATVLRDGGRFGAALVAIHADNRGWRIEEDVRNLQAAGWTNWATLEQVLTAPQLARGKFVLARLRLSSLRYEQAANLTTAYAEEWYATQAIAGFETNTVMRPSTTRGSTYVPGTSSTSTSRIGHDYLNRVTTETYTPGRFATTESTTMVPVPETRPVWETHYQRTGLSVGVVKMGFDQNLSTRDWLRVCAIVHLIQQEEDPEARPVVLLEILTSWPTPAAR
jgi:hypothetical protein